MTKIIEEIREITAQEVAKKQDAAKLNYPKIIEKIKAAAKRGLSECYLEEREINEYDRKMLEQDGFTSRLIDRSDTDDYKSSSYFRLSGLTGKVWVIKW